MATTSLAFDREAIAMIFEWEATPPIVFWVCLAVLCLQSVGVKGGSIMDRRKGVQRLGRESRRTAGCECQGPFRSGGWLM